MPPLSFLNPALLCGLAAAAMLCSCGDKIAAPKVEAEKVAKRHFEAIARKDYDAALADYSPDFFKITARDKWLKVLAEKTAGCGEFISYVVDGGNLNYWAGVSSEGKKPGATVELRCDVTYRKVATRETFTLFKGFSEPRLQIIAHNISPLDAPKKPDAK